MGAWGGGAEGAAIVGVLAGARPPGRASTLLRPAGAHAQCRSADPPCMSMLQPKSRPMSCAARARRSCCSRCARWGGRKPAGAAAAADVAAGGGRRYASAARPGPAARRLGSCTGHSPPGEGPSHRHAGMRQQRSSAGSAAARFCVPPCPDMRPHLMLCSPCSLCLCVLFCAAQGAEAGAERPARGQGHRRRPQQAVQDVSFQQGGTAAQRCGGGTTAPLCGSTRQCSSAAAMWRGGDAAAPRRAGCAVNYPCWMAAATGEQQRAHMEARCRLGLTPVALPSPRPALPACSKVVRKGIARVLTVVNQKTRDALKEAYKGKVRTCAAAVSHWEGGCWNRTAGFCCWHTSDGCGMSPPMAAACGAGVGRHTVRLGTAAAAVHAVHATPAVSGSRYMRLAGEGSWGASHGGRRVAARQPSTALEGQSAWRQRRRQRRRQPVRHGCCGP